jgi:RND superfamily putative drug exporter
MPMAARHDDDRDVGTALRSRLDIGRFTMLTRLGRFTVRRRRLVVSLTVVFLIVAAVLGSGAFGVLKSGGFDDPASESSQAEQVLADRFGGGDPNVVLVADAGRSVDDADVAAAGAALTAELEAMPGVEQVASYWSLGSPPPLRSNDGESALIVARVTGADEAEIETRIAEVRDAVEGTRWTFTGDTPFEVQVGGREAVFADVGHTIEGDLLRAEMIAVPLTILLLLFVFRSVVAASLPLAVGVVAVFGTFLSLFVIGSITDVSIYAINLTTALGLGLAIDYSLFIVSRFREELRAGRTVEGAVVRTVETAGRTILISGLTVAVSLAALLVFPQYFLRSFAYAGIAVVAMAVAASLLTLPATLAMIGTNIDRGRIGRGDAADRPEHEGFWHRVAVFVMRRPVPIALATTALLLFLGSPFLRVAFATPDDRVLPADAPARLASETLRSEFSGNASESFGVVLDGVGPQDGGVIDTTASAISALDGVARVESSNGVFIDGGFATTTAADGRFQVVDENGAVSWMSVVPTFPVVSAEGEELVETIRSLDLPVEVQVEGAAAGLVDTKASIADRLPLAITIIVVATFVLLFLLSGSLLVPAKALVLNALSLTATFGAMVWIFQDGNLADWLGFTATGAIDVSMPILMFCIAFGLSMDYEVFLLSRIKEEHDRTGDNEASVALGLERTGRIVTAAAALLAITFFAFGTSGVSFIKMFGIGLGIAVLMDATIVRGLLVPAFMRLAGEANWWAPAPLRRFHERFGIRESDDDHRVDDGTGSDGAVDGELVGAGR